MRDVHDDSTPVVTGSAIADAVIEDAAALGANGLSDTVHVPTFDEHGTAVTATLLLGPASQIVVAEAPDDLLEPEDDDLVATLRAAARRLGAERVPHADQ